MPNCYSGLKFLVLSSRKVHISPNSKNQNLAHLCCTKNWLWVGSSKFFAYEQPEHARSTGTAALSRKTVHSRKTHVLTNGSANVSNRKRTYHRGAFQRNSIVKQHCTTQKKTTLDHRNSAELLQ